MPHTQKAKYFKTVPRHIEWFKMWKARSQETKMPGFFPGGEGTILLVA